MQNPGRLAERAAGCGETRRPRPTAGGTCGGQGGSRGSRVRPDGPPGGPDRPPLQRSLQLWGSQPRAPRVRTFRTERWRGSPQATGRRQAPCPAPVFSLLTLLCIAAEMRPSPRPPRPYLRAPPPSSPRTPGVARARETQSRPAAPMPRGSPGGTRSGTRASGSSARAGLEPEAAAGKGRWVLI